MLAHRKEAGYYFAPASTWGHSSAGRAPAWHAGGRRFDPAWLHQLPDNRPSGKKIWQHFRVSPSSRGLGHSPFAVAPGVRTPGGTPLILKAGETGPLFLPRTFVTLL